jgi:hypothetical protein
LAGVCNIASMVPFMPPVSEEDSETLLAYIVLHDISLLTAVPSNTTALRRDIISS